jgi:hypothetical protein
MNDHNSYMKRVKARNIGDSGRHSEKRVAKTLQARLTPASGALKGHKGDMRLERNMTFLVEAKSTTGDTMRLDLGWLVKIQSEALNTRRKPMITVSFVDEGGKLRGVKEDWVCIPRSVLDELLEKPDE